MCCAELLMKETLFRFIISPLPPFFQCSTISSARTTVSVLRLLLIWKYSKWSKFSVILVASVSEMILRVYLKCLIVLAAQSPPILLPCSVCDFSFRSEMFKGLFLISASRCLIYFYFEPATESGIGLEGNWPNRTGPGPNVGINISAELWFFPSFSGIIDDDILLVSVL